MNLQFGVFFCVVVVASSALLGGFSNVDINDEGVPEVLKWTVAHMNGLFNSHYHHVLIGQPQVYRQIVNGVNYRLKITLAPSKCLNNGDNLMKSVDECPVMNGAQHQECQVKVFDSRTKYSLKNFKCNPKEVKSVLGGDDHDRIPHGKRSANLFGQDTHDYVPHGESSKKILGQDTHDYVPHGDSSKNIFGQDTHDYVPHGNSGKKMFGQDTHDYVPHGDSGKKMFGQDTHDYVPHGDSGKKMFGQDTHDYVPHGDSGKKMFGQDTHDYVPHGDSGKKMFGQDTHDYVPHGDSGKKMFGQDTHDYVPHGDSGKKMFGQDTHDYVPHGKSGKPKNVHHMSILGGDDTDFKPHSGDACFEYYEQFVEFTTKYNRVYGGREETSQRFQIFCDNMKKVKMYQEMERGTATYGATMFADISEEEFKQNYLGLKLSERKGKVWPAAEIPKGKAPEAFDWREHGAVTEVKNQGNCGSCWAFSTTGNIEGQYAIKHKTLISLSEQELVDCDHIDEGCNGGLPSQAYEALEKLGGIETEKDYSYRAEDEKCLFNKSKVAAKVSGAVNISSNEADMAAWLAKNGPISIGINAFAMQFYFGGIAHPWKIFCNPSKLDHGVLIVGYGVRGSEPYWIIKNSWGPQWGVQGYYLVYRGDGVCGLNTMCTSSVVV